MRENYCPYQEKMYGLKVIASFQKSLLIRNHLIHSFFRMVFQWLKLNEPLTFIDSNIDLVHSLPILI